MAEKSALVNAPHGNYQHVMRCIDLLVTFPACLMKSAFGSFSGMVYVSKIAPDSPTSKLNLFGAPIPLLV